MTIHHLRGIPGGGQSEPEPARSGQPWTTDDYETLVKRCREGASVSELAQALDRSEFAVVTRAKRLLPADQRGAPQDHVITHLRRLLQEDADYDWGHHLASTPPPRPVVNHLPAPQVRRGIPGLSDHDLMTVAGLMVRLGEDPSTDPLRREVVSAIRTRRLPHELAIRLKDEVDLWVDVFLWGRRASHYRDDSWDPPPPYDGPYDIGPDDEPEHFDPGPDDEPPW